MKWTVSLRTWSLQLPKVHHHESGQPWNALTQGQTGDGLRCHNTSQRLPLFVLRLLFFNFPLIKIFAFMCTSPPLFSMSVVTRFSFSPTYRWTIEWKARSFNISLRFFPVSVLWVFCFVFWRNVSIIDDKTMYGHWFPAWRMSHFRFRSFSMNTRRLRGLISFEIALRRVASKNLKKNLFRSKGSLIACSVLGLWFKGWQLDPFWSEKLNSNLLLFLIIFYYFLYKMILQFVIDIYFKSWNCNYVE